MSGSSTGSELNLLIGRLAQAVGDLEKNSTEPWYRTKAIEAAQCILERLKTPGDRSLDRYFETALSSAIHVLVHFKAFDAIPLEGTISYEALAGKVNAEAELIRRLAGPLVAGGILRQEGTDHVAHTPVSRSYIGSDSQAVALQQTLMDHVKSFTSLPAYFDKYGRKEPTTRTHTPSSFAFGFPELTLWEILRRDPNPARVASFMATMTYVEPGLPQTGVYDFSWLVAEASSPSCPPDRPLMVDVGASMGHITKAILRTTPGLSASRCVLQDLPEVVEELVKIDDPELREVRKIPINFHKEQPVKGALLYFIRRCLHDYSDGDCVEILKPLANAMAADSRLVIIEEIKGNPPDARIAMIDLSMLTIGGKERSIEDFAVLASKTGLKIREVYRKEGVFLSAIECVKA